MEPGGKNQVYIGEHTREKSEVCNLCMLEWWRQKSKREVSCH